MSKEEFTAGPAQSGLLNYSEASITYYIIYIYIVLYIFFRYISHIMLIVTFKLNSLHSETLRLNFIGLIFILIFHIKS